MHKRMNGDEALAWGTLEAGVRIVTGYPGSPSSKVVGHLLRWAERYGVYVEWAINEKVALEEAMGASIGGRRALVCLKSVGMNVALDPLMVINLTGVHAGLVLLLGDDPGAWLSQNEQDTRLIARLAEVPLLEPSSPQEGKEMMAAAFALSEAHRTPVIVREVRGFSGAEGLVPFSEPQPPQVESSTFPRGKMRWISTGVNAIRNHRKLHEKGKRIAEAFEESPFNRREGTGEKGVIAAGFAYAKLREAIGSDFSGLSLLRLETLYPLPERTLIAFLKDVTEVLVLEENEPYLETAIQAVAYRAGVHTKIWGKLSGHIVREGALQAKQIREGLQRALGVGKREASEWDEEVAPSSAQTALCEGCPYIPAFGALKEAMRELDVEAVLTGDPGCTVRLLQPPVEMLDVKYAMGDSIGVAAGLHRAGVREKVIAVVGDSSFFHSAINGLINAVQHRAKILVVVLDNGSAALTGFQPHPGSGRDAMGWEAPRIRIEDLARVCSIDFVRVVDPDDFEETKTAFLEGLAREDLGVIVVRKPCPIA